MKDFTKQYDIASPIAEVWAYLTEPKKIEQWTGSKAIMELTIGGQFKLWDDSIYGTNTKIEAPTLLEQEWYGGHWEEPSYVKFELTQVDDNTTHVVLTHTNLPDSEADSFNSGWDEYYFGPMKELLEKTR